MGCCQGQLKEKEIETGDIDLKRPEEPLLKQEDIEPKIQINDVDKLNEIQQYNESNTKAKNSKQNYEENYNDNQDLNFDINNNDDEKNKENIQNKKKEDECSLHENEYSDYDQQDDLTYSQMCKIQEDNDEGINEIDKQIQEQYEQRMKEYE